jgi:hypothetical protein
MWLFGAAGSEVCHGSMDPSGLPHGERRGSRALFLLVSIGQRLRRCKVNSAGSKRCPMRQRGHHIATAEGYNGTCRRMELAEG